MLRSDLPPRNFALRPLTECFLLCRKLSVFFFFSFFKRNGFFNAAAAAAAAAAADGPGKRSGVAAGLLPSPFFLVRRAQASATWSVLTICTFYPSQIGSSELSQPNIHGAEVGADAVSQRSIFGRVKSMPNLIDPPPQPKKNSLQTHTAHHCSNPGPKASPLP
jgi:hypothetical protein